MAWFKRSSQFTILAVALTLSTSFNALAQLPSRSTSSSFGSQLANSFRPPNRGMPDNRQGGATRGPCFVDEKKLTALVPITGGETATDNPTVFWYMPKMSAKENAAPAPEIEFTLRDTNDQKVYSASYPLTKSANDVAGTPGIMSLTVAKSYPLKAGQEYKWQIRVTCDATSSDRSDDQYAEGSIKRVATDTNFQRRVQNASPEERILLYAQNQLWYEMLADLVALRRARPTDPNLADAWEKLFAVVNLDNMSKQPLFQGARTIDN